MFPKRIPWWWIQLSHLPVAPLLPATGIAAPGFLRSGSFQEDRAFFFTGLISCDRARTRHFTPSTGDRRGESPRRLLTGLCWRLGAFGTGRPLRYVSCCVPTGAPIFPEEALPAKAFPHRAPLPGETRIAPSDRASDSCRRTGSPGSRGSLSHVGPAPSLPGCTCSPVGPKRHPEGACPPGPLNRPGHPSGTPEAAGSWGHRPRFPYSQRRATSRGGPSSKLRASRKWHSSSHGRREGNLHCRHRI